MVKQTFIHIPEEKQARVRAALLEEFSLHPLSTAQVAPIVKSAGIARGAFYKYFDDLRDAYTYEFGMAMRDIHAALPPVPTYDNVDAYVDSIRSFMDKTNKSEYRSFIEMHYRFNESVLGAEPTAQSDPKSWAITVLYHQTVRDVVLDPASLEDRLKTLRIILKSNKETNA
jgi:AcrR family transcriptional regulator